MQRLLRSNIIIQVIVIESNKEKGCSSKASFAKFAISGGAIYFSPFTKENKS